MADEIDFVTEDAERNYAVARRVVASQVERIPVGVPGDCDGPCADYSPRLVPTKRGLLCPRCRDRFKLP